MRRLNAARGSLVGRLLPLAVPPSRRDLSFVLLVFALASAAQRPPGERPDTSQAGTFAFVNTSVVPMTSDVVLPSHTVVIRGDRISEIAPSHTVKLPADARTIDASGTYLIPGLVDFHVHLRAPGELDSYLRYGVTTVVALRGTEMVLGLRERVRAKALVGPRVRTAGPLIDGEPPIWSGGATRVVTTAGEARAAAEAHCRAGHDFVKVYNNLLPHLLADVITVAHECGIPVIGHLPRRPDREKGLVRALAAGMDVIAHGEEVFFTHLGGASDDRIAREAAVNDEAIETAVRMISESGAYVIPNLSFIAMTARMLDDAEGVFGDPEFGRLAPGVRQLWRDQNPTRRRDLEAFRRRERAKRAAVTTLTARLQAAGVPLLLGTDASAPGVFPGKAAHVELEELVKSGLTPYQAIATGTATAGRFFHDRLGAADRRRGQSSEPVGTIEPGAMADLVLVRENPLASVGNLALMEGVMVRGHWRPSPAR